MTDQQIVQQTVAGLEKEGFLKAGQVITTDVRRVKYAYPIYDLNRERNRQIIADWCASQDIRLCGRFAEFSYMNSDAVIRSAKTCAESLLKHKDLADSDIK